MVLNSLSTHRIGQHKEKGSVVVNESMEDRARRLALYIIENRTTVRSAARKFGISKSTVHKDDGVIIGTVKGNAKKH